jgi:hypothetical protein
MNAPISADTSTHAPPRSVSGVVLSGVLQLPPLPARLLADWQRETSQHLNLQPGDVEELPLARARARWPQFAQCVGAASDWARWIGLQDALADSPLALMACRGARYHHDAATYSSAAFCNLFVGEDQGQEVHFPFTGHRIPLVHGTVLLFDTGQPHAVRKHGRTGFDPGDFAAARDCTQMFLTWELTLGDPAVARVLSIRSGDASSTGLQWSGTQLLCDGEAGTVCPHSGRWQRHATALPT